MKKVIKRTGECVNWNRDKVIIAINKAMKSIGITKYDISEKISNDIEELVIQVGELSVRQIEGKVYHSLIEYGCPDVARAYEGYRSIQEYKRKNNTTDSSIESLLALTSDVVNENSNKDAKLIATQRDLIAGEISKDLVRRKILPAHIVQAHDDGTIHIHDMDYMLQKSFNCCIVDLEDMLENGTVINGKMVESPKSFQVACTVTTQIIAQIASNQYGGTSINKIDSTLAPYARKSFDKYLKEAMIEMEMYDIDVESNMEKAVSIADKRMRKEIKDGVQTIQYQINTLMTTNGQSPFVTLLMHFEEDYEYAYEASIVTEEIIKQRLKGIKNEKGMYITPAFPKLIYVLDEHNIHNKSKYYYLTELSAKCSAKRMYPDYISAKKMKEIYEGNVFSPMGCRAFLSPYKDEQGKYKFDGRFNQGVVSLNLPQIGLMSKGNKGVFWENLKERLELVKEALLIRYNLLKDTTSDVSPIHWQHGAIARLEKGEKITKLLHNGYSTLTLGYIGLYELTKIVEGESHTKRKEFSLNVLKYMKDTVDKWSEELNIKFALYGTPSESMAGRLCNIDKQTFGEIEDITDKGYYVNSYHVDVREEIDAFTKLSFESEYQKISTGGCISYVEIPNLNNNIEAVITLMKFIYDNISYAEFNTKSDYCHICGFDGEIIINDDLEWECPQCHNKNKERMNVVRRTCGYLGENFWTEARTRDIKDRVLHL